VVGCILTCLARAAPINLHSAPACRDVSLDHAFPWTALSMYYPFISTDPSLSLFIAAPVRDGCQDASRDKGRPQFTIA
jgi:hypothetical protein